MNRILVAGGPLTGKTTLAQLLGGALGVATRSTEVTADMHWSDASQAVSGWLDEPGPWVIEGVVVPRALRKWLLRNATGCPADLLVWLPLPWAEVSRGQSAMAKGCQTVFGEVVDELRLRGMTVLARPGLL